ncbi:hypothetical protein T4D_654 [Trichinella pseudospiralis]|uniref:Uncharacterized protein n=1 Tax=Trichinella pseudospiralis TaxID=6337 RepID=A0A0V1FPL0_TRIPS|nr:hypothetical protein T4D_654 [Trichinella pseudospiralis]
MATRSVRSLILVGPTESLCWTNSPSEKGCWKRKFHASAHEHKNDVGLRDCVLLCVIVLCARVEFDQCTFMFIDKRSLSLNKAGFHCF